MFIKYNCKSWCLDILEIEQNIFKESKSFIKFQPTSLILLLIYISFVVRKVIVLFHKHVFFFKLNER